jgi:hypothetical protein
VAPVQELLKHVDAAPDSDALALLLLLPFRQSALFDFVHVVSEVVPLCRQTTDGHAIAGLPSDCARAARRH